MKKSAFPPILHGKCMFCGADNDKDIHPHIRIKEEGGIFVHAYCDNCSARTETKRSQGEAVSAWMGGHYTIPVQAESRIYQECVNMMHGLVEDFNEWLEWQGIEVPFEERFRVGRYPAQIVNDLFLRHTKHSGGTSTRAKCRELGIDDCTRLIWFDVSEEEE